MVLLFIAIKFRLSSSYCSDCFEWGVEYHGGGLEDPMVTGVTSPDSCQLLCQEWRLNIQIIRLVLIITIIIRTHITKLLLGF